MKEFRSECLRPIALAFLANLTRTSRFALMPALLALLARRGQLWVDYIAQKLGRSIDPHSKEYSPPNFSSEEAELAASLMEKHEAAPDAREQIDNLGIRYIEYNLKIGDEMHESMMAVLSTIVLESWSAFETLTSDLWATAVDRGPKEIRVRVANSTKLLKPDENIGPKQLLDVEFDPSTHYGSSLRELGRVSFQRLEYIKRFYSVAFDYDFSQMFSKVESGYITALSAFRNALIHNAGKADKKFVKQVQSFAEFRSIKHKDTLMLDGEVVRKLHSSAILLGWDLIGFVDGVLTPPPNDADGGS